MNIHVFSGNFINTYYVSHVSIEKKKDSNDDITFKGSHSRY